ncbi:MAG TPA: GNAT family N-acetyltransferase [Chlamydiales bacterium]|jgi:putative acetyltransferase
MKDPLTFRQAQEADQKYLVEWLLQPGVLEGFPLSDLREIEDAARIWMSYAKLGATLIAEENGIPCGTAVLYLQPYQKLSHQCLLAIIVDEKWRNQGVGKKLLLELMALAKEKCHIELLHLEVYEGNPAIRLYERLGFVRYGFQKHFVKDQGRYIGKILMQKRI